MSLKALLGLTAGLAMKQTIRNHHVYRPIAYCDWYKPPDSFYYELRCPPEPKVCCKPAVVREKRCEVCSFWQQMKDNCCGFFWPIPPMPMRSEPRVYVCKDLRKKRLTQEEAQERRQCFNLNDCYDIPDCPKPTWQVYIPKNMDTS